MPLQSNALNKVFLIIAMTACYAMIFIDQSGVAVTLPRIQQSLVLSSNAIHWVVNAYVLVIAVLLLLGGKLADIYGYRKIFISGLVLFLLASVICAIAQDSMMLLAGRVVQGVGASLIMPCVAVLIHMNFAENEFGKAFGIILAASNFFFAMGPFIGGILTEFINWRWFFLVNIPIGGICLYLTFLTIAKDTVIPGRKFSDIKGLLVFIIGISAMVVALMQGDSFGWSSMWTIVLFIVAIVGILLFIKIELRADEPLLQIRLFANKIFATSSIILFCASVCLASMVFWALWLQTGLGFLPATVGIALLPATVAFIFMPPIGGAWADKVGPRSPLLLGSILILIGVVWIAITAQFQSYAWIIFGLLAVGFGIPLTIPTSITSMVTAVEAEQRGMASGTYGVAMQVSTAIGFAIMSAIIASYSNSHFSQLIKTSVDYAGITVHQISVLLAGKNLISNLDTVKLAVLKQAATLIYTHAFAYGMAAICLFAAIACILSFLFIPKK